MSAPVGPYQPVVRAGDWLVVSGQIGIGPDGLAEGVAAQLDRALANLDAHLVAAGATARQVVKTTVFLVGMDDYATMNERYVAYFADRAGDHRPARSAVGVAELPMGALVEVEAWVYTAGDPVA